MTKNTFVDCEKSLHPDDFLLIERDLSIELPVELKKHYLDFNGGSPKNSIWNFPLAEWAEIEIRDFFPLLYFEAKQHDPDFTANGIAREQWVERKLPASLFPFAIDWGGNYFCVDINDGMVYYFLRDVWSENISIEQNWTANTRNVAKSFSEFVDGLTEG